MPHMGTGTLPIGSRDMYALKLLVWVAQMGGELTDGTQLVLQGVCTFLLVHGQTGKHPIQSFTIGIHARPKKVAGVV